VLLLHLSIAAEKGTHSSSDPRSTTTSEWCVMSRAASCIFVQI
jgi:hypothetical protein